MPRHKPKHYATCAEPGCVNLCNNSTGYCYRHINSCPDCGKRILPNSKHCGTCAQMTKNQPHKRTRKKVAGGKFKSLGVAGEIRVLIEEYQDSLNRGYMTELCRLRIDALNKTLSQIS